MVFQRRPIGCVGIRFSVIHLQTLLPHHAEVGRDLAYRQPPICDHCRSHARLNTVELCGERDSEAEALKIAHLRRSFKIGEYIPYCQIVKFVEAKTTSYATFSLSQPSRASIMKASQPA